MGAGSAAGAAAAPSTMSSYVHHVAMFSGWLAERVPEVSSPARITRTVLEDWLLSIRSSGLAPGTKISRVSAVRLFLEEQWEDGLARMPRSATIHAGEVPVSGPAAPARDRGCRVRSADRSRQLALLPSEQHRTIILLLAFTGLRISSIVTLARDALEIGTDGHPYLRYLNVKLRREAVIPIGPVLHEQLSTRSGSSPPRSEWTAPASCCPRRRPVAEVPPAVSITCRSRGVRHMLKRYVQTAEIRDSQGGWRLAASAPVPPPSRHQPGQRRRAAVGHPAGARSRIDSNDRPLRAS